jgi:hypothetical protein
VQSEGKGERERERERRRRGRRRRREERNFQGQRKCNLPAGGPTPFPFLPIQYIYSFYINLIQFRK